MKDQETSNWSVWRQDDNGVKGLIQSNLDQQNAERLVAELEARGHKQVYWASEAQPSPSE